MLQHNLSKAGVTLTGDLINSVQSITQGLANRYEPEIVFEFRDYMRYLDMKTITYTGYTNTDAIIQFVQKVGVQNFAFVSGRESEGNPTNIAKAESKIAWAILHHRRQKLTVTHAANRRIYNKTKMLIFNKIRREIGSVNGLETLNALKKTLI
jgi:hypothetical protein